jgi:tripartite ATP-independent transporter DctP family solute receptor
MKALTGIVTTIAAMSLMVGCGTGTGNGNASTGSQAVKTIRLGMTTGPTSAQNIAAAHFADLVKQYSNGSIKVQIYPSSQLGTASAMLQDLSSNTMQMVVTATADTVVPQMQALELPYLFPNEDVAVKVANGPVANQINQLFLPKGMRVLANWDSGFREITTRNHPITGVDSMKGLRIRVINSPIWIDLFKALGANPIPMDYNQVYTGLQQGTVDAEENPISNIYGAHFYEVSKNLAMTSHSFGVATVLVSEPFWKTLTQDQQNALSKAVTETTSYETQLTKQQEQDYLKKMEQTGVKVTNPALAPFQQATQVVYKELEPSIGADLITQVEQAAKNAK